MHNATESDASKINKENLFGENARVFVRNFYYESFECNYIVTIKLKKGGIRVKKILITGSNSYIGTSVEKWLKKSSEDYLVDTIDMIDGTWKEKDFSYYDVVFHVAGIAHISTNYNMEDLYYKVNRDLAIETARKAKAEGIKQFIFMSSIIVYGDSSSINHKRVIDKNTVPTPSNFYGRSKLQAEQGIRLLQDDNFSVVVIRPPMVFGKGSKGNYPKLAKIARKLPIFPNIINERSMIHIDNICEFIRLIIANEERGVFFPQNREYVGTSELVKLVAEAHGKNIVLTKMFNWLLILMGCFVGSVNKAFGNLVYDKSMSEYKVEYIVRDLKESVMMTERE